MQILHAGACAGLDGPTDIWFDGEGNMLVSDWKAGSIQRFDASGAYVATFVDGLSQSQGQRWA